MAIRDANSDPALTAADFDSGTVASGTTIIQNLGASPVVVGQGASKPTDLMGGTVLTGEASVTVEDGKTYYLRAASSLPARVSITSGG